MNLWYNHNQIRNVGIPQNKLSIQRSREASDAQNLISPGIGLIKTIKCSQLFEINFESVWCEGIKKEARQWGKQPRGRVLGERHARAVCLLYSS